LRETFGPDLTIVFLSGDRIEAYDRVAGGLLLGADDYVVKPFAHELVAPGSAACRPYADAALASRLARRELQVLRLLAEGKPQREIATALVISPKTVGTHIKHILSKLGVRNRSQAVALAYRRPCSRWWSEKGV
jgi:DNA-binding NarL/FixJ family response regulator